MICSATTDETEAAVARFLRCCGPDLERRYGPVFQRHEIDAFALRLCSDNDLRNVLGVSEDDAQALRAAASHDLVDTADAGIYPPPDDREAGRERGGTAAAAGCRGAEESGAEVLRQHGGIAARKPRGRITPRDASCGPVFHPELPLEHDAPAEACMPAQGAAAQSLGGEGWEGSEGHPPWFSSPDKAEAEAEAASPSLGSTALDASAGRKKQQPGNRDTDDTSPRGGSVASQCRSETRSPALLQNTNSNMMRGIGGSYLSLEEEERQSSAAADPQTSSATGSGGGSAPTPQSCRKRRDAFGVLMGSAKAARSSSAGAGGTRGGIRSRGGTTAASGAAAETSTTTDNPNKEKAGLAYLSADASALSGSRTTQGKGPGGASKGASAGHWAAQGSRAPSRPPPWKTVPGTDFVVDGFYHCGPWSKNFFLSHFHADHYGGLDKSFSAGTVYCTQETARLVRMHLGVPKQRIISLEINKTHRIDGKAVTLVEANHCPGAVIFVFQVGTCTHVHCGDMRFEPSLLSEEFPVGLRGLRIDNLYLDTTYCDPRYAFPRQAEVLGAVDAIVRLEESRAAGSGKNKAGSDRERVLYLCGAYTIGKEKVWLQVFRSLGNAGAIHADPRRRRTLECLDLPRVLAALADEHCSPRRSFNSVAAARIPATSAAHGGGAGGGSASRGGANAAGMLGLLRRTSAAVRVTSDASSREAGVRVTTMGALSDTALHETLLSAPVRAAGFTRVVAFRPTGWSFRPPDRAQTKLTTVLSTSTTTTSGGSTAPMMQSSATTIAQGVGGSVRSVGAGGRIKVVSLPYSEHSSVEELQEMVRVLRPRRILPTVAKNAQHRSEILRLLTGSDGPPSVQQTAGNPFIATSL